jgi:hypothetical protein
VIEVKNDPLHQPMRIPADLLLQRLGRLHRHRIGTSPNAVVRHRGPRVAAGRGSTIRWRCARPSNGCGLAAVSSSRTMSARWLRQRPTPPSRNACSCIRCAVVVTVGPTASSRPEEFHLQALPGRVGDWRAGLVRSSCSPLARSFVCECHSISILRDAVALLFQICWPEPFGLVMIEAMSCSTPVLAYRAGSVPGACSATPRSRAAAPDGGAHVSGDDVDAHAD